MMNPDGTMGNIIVAFVGIAISMILGFVLTMIFYKDQPSDVVEVTEGRTESIVYSPGKGKVIPLSEVEDEAFSSGLLGKGVAMIPEEGVIYAPADGEISAFFPTGHAIGMKTCDGLEILIHVGMDTVQLDGKGFTPFVSKGDTVKKGQKLLEFDKEFIKKEGYSIVTPILISNFDQFDQIIPTDKSQVQAGDVLLKTY